MVKKISQNEFNEVIASEVAVIDFSATWCGPCKMMAEKILPLQEVGEYINGKFICVKFDMEKYQKVIDARKAAK